jgi:hypothetical protein
MNPHDLIDLAAIRQHCELLHRLAEPLKGKGKLSVSGFGDDPETGTALLPISMFEIGQVAPMVKFIAALTEKPHRNVYVPLAVLRPNLDPNKKGAEADVIGSLGLVGDFDDADAKNWRAPGCRSRHISHSKPRAAGFSPSSYSTSPIRQRR